jgi:hypothetical protein
MTPLSGVALSCVRINPTFMEAHYNLAVLLVKIPTRLPDAVSHFEAVLRIKPDPGLRQIVDRLRAEGSGAH